MKPQEIVLRALWVLPTIQVIDLRAGDAMERLLQMWGLGGRG